MARDSSGRFTSTKVDTTDGDENMTNFGSFLGVAQRLAARGRLGAAVVLVAGGAYFALPAPRPPYLPPFVAFGHEADLFPETMHLWTYDSTAPDGEKIQHKKIKLKGFDQLTGTYQYREIASHGVMHGFRRIGGGTIELIYGSEDPNGDSLGSITLRKLRFVSDNEPQVGIGFETGHDCNCGSGLSHEGPFTSVPAILTTSAEPPQSLKDLLMKVPTKAENFVWPADVQKALNQASN